MAAAAQGVSKGLGGAVDLGKSIFGETTHKNESGNATTYTNFRPQDQQAIQGQTNAVQEALKQLAGFGAQYGQESYNNRANIVTPNFNGPLDSTAKQLVSQQQATNQAGVNTQLQRIGQQFGGSNPGVANILKNQAINSNRLNGTPLTFAAQQEQTQRVGQQANAVNQAELQKQQSTNDALKTAFGFQSSGAGAQQDLLSTLLGIGKAFGQNVSQTSGQSNGKSGGLV